MTVALTNVRNDQLLAYMGVNIPQAQRTVQTLLESGYFETGLIIQPNGHFNEFVSSPFPIVREFQQVVGGLIEIIYSHFTNISFLKDHYLIVNAEGDLIGLPMNPTATCLYLSGAQPIVGPCLVIRKELVP